MSSNEYYISNFPFPSLISLTPVCLCTDKRTVIKIGPDEFEVNVVVVQISNISRYIALYTDKCITRAAVGRFVETTFYQMSEYLLNGLRVHQAEIYFNRT